MTKPYEAIRRAALSVASLTALALLSAACSAPTEAVPSNPEAACSDAGQWVDPATKQVMDVRTVFQELSGKDVVLLGESHTARDHHLWQSQTIAGLRAMNPNIVLGFEMFPRSVQSALDAWSAGELDEKSFLGQSRWSEVWGYAPEFYMPMFEQARINRNPMIALNVDRSLISKVGREGWASVAEEDREGVTDPAAASADYREALATVFLAKTRHGAGTQTGEAANAAGTGDGEPTRESVMASEPFGNFVQAQLTWDRAMAEALVAAKDRNPASLVIGVMGRGHVEYGHGVPHQLADLGIENVAILVPVNVGEDCEAVDPALADAVFTVDQASLVLAGPPKPRLGVIIEASEPGIRILRITPDSVAQASDLAVGDIIVAAAGIQVRQNRELVEVIQRQAPGTWLPLDVRRGEETLSIVAKFPPHPEGTQ